LFFRFVNADSGGVCLYAQRSFDFYRKPERGEPAELRFGIAGDVSFEKQAGLGAALRAAAALSKPVHALLLSARRPYSVTVTHADGLFARHHVSLPSSATLQALRDAVAAHADRRV
jgi:hypothetical protein